jgi:hypothetical protein
VALNVEKSETSSVRSDNQNGSFTNEHNSIQPNLHPSLQEFKENYQPPSPSGFFNFGVWGRPRGAQTQEDHVDSPSNIQYPSWEFDPSSLNQTGCGTPSAPIDTSENKEQFPISPTQMDDEVASINFDNFNTVYSSCQNITLLSLTRSNAAICTSCFKQYQMHHPAVRRKFVILQKRAEKLAHPTIVVMPIIRECNVCMENETVVRPVFPTLCCNYLMCVTCINTLINTYNNDDNLYFGCPQCRARSNFAAYLRANGRVQLQVAVQRVEDGHYLPLQNNFNVEEANNNPDAAHHEPLLGPQPEQIINLPQPQQPQPIPFQPQPRNVRIADVIFQIPQRYRAVNIAGVEYLELVDDLPVQAAEQPVPHLRRFWNNVVFYALLLTVAVRPYIVMVQQWYNFIYNYLRAVQPDLLVPNQPGLGLAVRDQIIPWNPNGHPSDLFEVDEEAYLPENPNAPNGRFILWMGDRRILTPPHAWRAYQFPRLAFIGWWNGATGGTTDYLTHFGGHFKTDYISVLLPHSIVNELGTFWNRAARTPENYAVSLIKCGNLVAQLNINSFQERIITLYAPVVAYRLFWDEKQNVSRVRDRAYVHSNFRVSLNKTMYALGKYKFGVLIALISLVLSGVGFHKFYLLLSAVDFYYLLPFYIVILGCLALLFLLFCWRILKKFFVFVNNAINSI